MLLWHLALLTDPLADDRHRPRAGVPRPRRRPAAARRRAHRPGTDRRRRGPPLAPRAVLRRADPSDGHATSTNPPTASNRTVNSPTPTPLPRPATTTRSTTCASPTPPPSPPRPTRPRCRRPTTRHRDGPGADRRAQRRRSRLLHRPLRRPDSWARDYLIGRLGVDPNTLPSASTGTGSHARSGTRPPAGPPSSTTCAITAPPTRSCSPPGWPRPPPTAGSSTGSATASCSPSPPTTDNGEHRGARVHRPPQPPTRRSCHDVDLTGRYLNPKYLNTPDTALFHKGQELYGLAEHRDQLADGATPVLVEGPVDALAVTIAGITDDTSDDTTASAAADPLLSPPSSPSGSSASRRWAPRSPATRPTPCTATSQHRCHAGRSPPTPTSPGNAPPPARSGT